MNDIARAFYDDCVLWHTNHGGHNYRGRQQVYSALIEKYDIGPVIRHAARIVAILDRLEADAMFSLYSEGDE